MTTPRIDSWWPFDVRAFALAEATLSDRESIVRIRLLNHAWQKGGVLPLDQKALTRIARAPPKVWLACLGEFDHTTDGWVHKGLKEQYDAAEFIREQNAEKGRKSGEARRNKANSGSTVVQLPLNRS